MHDHMHTSTEDDMVCELGNGEKNTANIKRAINVLKPLPFCTVKSALRCSKAGIPITRVSGICSNHCSHSLWCIGKTSRLIGSINSVTWRMAMSVSLTNPIAINPHNVSSLAFNIGTLVDFSLDPLRRRDWRTFYIQQTAILRANYYRQAKKYAYYHSLLVDSNPSLCFQDVIIQKSPSINPTSQDLRNNTASHSNKQPQYGQDYFVLGVPLQVVCEINQQLGKHHAIPLGTCQTIITGDYYWMTVSPPPAYPPQVSLMEGFSSIRILITHVDHCIGIKSSLMRTWTRFDYDGMILWVKNYQSRAGKFMLLAKLGYKRRAILNLLLQQKRQLIRITTTTTTYLALNYTTLISLSVWQYTGWYWLVVSRLSHHLRWILSNN